MAEAYFPPIVVNSFFAAECEASMTIESVSIWFGFFFQLPIIVFAGTVYNSRFDTNISCG